MIPPTQPDSNVAFLLALSDALHPLTDAVEVLRVACRMLGEHLGADRAHYVETDDLAQAACGRARDTRGDSLPRDGDFHIANLDWAIPIMRQGQMVVVPDVANSRIVPADDQPVLAAVRVAALVAAPLVKGGVLVGVLCVTESRPRAWAAGEVELVREAGERTWAAAGRARAVSALRVSEARFRRVFESNAVGMIRWDLDRSLILDANDTFLRMTGYSRGDVAAGRLNFRQMIPAEWTPRNEEGIRTIREGGHAGPYEKEYFRNDGSRLPLLIVGTRFDDSPSAGMSLIIDISDRKRVEGEVDEARRRFERIAAATPGLLYLFDLTDVRNVYVNEGVRQVLGYTPEHVAALGSDFIPALIHPDDVPHIMEGNRGFDRLADGAVYEHEYRMRHADGSWRLVRSRDTVFTRTPDGRAHTILGLAEDITDRRAADELRDSRSLLELVALLGSDWWFTARVEADGTAVTETLSPEFTRQLGYTRDELTAAGGWHVILHPDDAAYAERQFARLMAGEEIEGELRHIAKDGRVLWHHYRTRPEADASGRVVRLVGASRDITARKEAEEGRRANDQLLRAVAAGLPNAAVFVVTPDLRYTMAGGAALEAAGFTPAEFEGRTLAEVLPPELLASSEPYYRGALAGRSFHTEHLSHGRHYVTHGSPLRDADGRVVAVMAVSYDITARVDAEAQARRADERLRLALTAARMGTWEWDVAGDAHSRDANLNALLGLPPVATRTPFDDFLSHIHPTDRADVRQAFDQSVRLRRPLNSEFRVVWPDGEVRWLRDQGDLFHTAGGPRLGGACVDITDLKAAERATREGEERLRQIVDSATDYAILTLTAARTVTSWSPGAEAIFGYPADEMIGRPVDVLFTPEDRAAGAPAGEVETASATGRASDERWHVRRDGTRFFASGVLFSLAGGGFVKVARDLTARKRQEEELERRVMERTGELAAALEVLEGEMGRRRVLARQLSTAQEDERRRVSRDLHDTLGQLQAALGLAVARVRSTQDLPTAASDQLDEVQRLADTLARETHALAVRLRPTALDDFGLEPALAQLTADWAARTGTPVDLQTAGLEGGRLSSEVETAVYRMVQEALTNVRKHARATRVGVSVTRVDRAAFAAVEDDGVGFNLEAVAPGRIGLVGMRERVELAGGTLEVESGSDGTTVLARFVLSGAAS